MKVFVVTYSYHDYYGDTNSYVGLSTSLEGCKQVIKNQVDKEHILGLTCEKYDYEREREYCEPQTFNILDLVEDNGDSFTYKDHEWNIIEEELDA